MAFDGLKKLFNRIGGVTIDSSKKVGDGVQAPVNKIGNIRSPVNKLGNVKSFSRGENKDFKSQFKPRKTSPRVIERMQMDKDEIQMFKELIDKKYEQKEKSKDDKAKADVYHKAALEEILKEEEKEGLDPKLIMGMGAVSFIVVTSFNDRIRIWI